jgi:ribosomal protein S18 acetylase RimI-like enzyme
VSGGSVVVEAIDSPDDTVRDALAKLLPQLSREAVAPGPEELRSIVGGEATTLLVARDETKAIVGSLTLAVFRVPTGMRAWIEDVVVDEAARGRGVATALVLDALDRAKRAGARTVELTSRPSREEANRLYRQLGFVPRETNVYRISVENAG